MSNDVNHPSHYNSGKIEVIDFIEDQRLGFNLGNTIKYISRSGKKGDSPYQWLTDLLKARWYLEREIKALETRLDQSDPALLKPHFNVLKVSDDSRSK